MKSSRIWTLLLLFGVILTIGVSSDEKTTHLLLRRSNGTIALFDPKLKQVVNQSLVAEKDNGISAFVSYTNETIYYATAKQNGPLLSSSKERRNVTWHSREWTKSAMAIDYTTEKLYILDDSTGDIKVVDMMNDYYKTIVSGLEETIDILLDSQTSYMYILQSHVITETFLDGSFPMLIANHKDMLKFEAFAMDRSNRILYYADRDQVYAYHYGGGDPEIIPPLDLKNVKSLAFADNHLYYIEDENEGVDKILKSCQLNVAECGRKCCEINELLVDPTLEVIKVVDVEPPKADNNCEKGNGGCEQMCLHSKTQRCACADGWNLDGTECHPEDELFALTAATTIRKYDFQNKNFGKALVEGKWGIQSFGLYGDGTIFYATTQFDQSILSNSNYEEQQITSGWTKTGIAVDTATEKIYVVDEEHGQVNVINIENEYATNLLTKLNQPKNVALDPDYGVMFVHQADSIMQADMDGRNVKTIFTASEITAIAVDRRNEKLYVAASDVIACVQYKLDRIFTVTNLNDTKAISLAVLNGDLFAVIVENVVDRSIQRCQLASGAESCNFTLVHADNQVSQIQSLGKIDIPKTPCNENNGGCDHLCLLTSEPEHYSCACKSGWKKEGKKCHLGDELFVQTSATTIRKFDFEHQKCGEPLVTNERGIESFEISADDSIFYATTMTDESILCTNSKYKEQHITSGWTKSALTVDSATGKIYVVDEEHGQINVVNMDNEYATVLLTNLNKPKNVELDPGNGVMFVQLANSVIQADMDGKKMRSIFDSPDSEISAIEIDRRNEKLYIATSNVITCIQYKADESHEVAKLDDMEAVSLAVLDGDLFTVIVTNAGDRSIQRCPLADGAVNCKFTLVYADNEISHIKSLVKIEKLKSPCSENNGGCDHLCLLTSESQHYSCACIPGWKLEGTKCYPEDELFVHASSKTISKFDFRTKNLGKPVVKSRWGIQSFGLYGDGTIFYATTLTDEPISSTNKKYKKLESTSGWEKSRLAVDSATGKIYVADEEQQQVHVVDIEKGYTKVLLKRLNGPRNVELDPRSGLMFVQLADSVIQADMDGENMKIIFSASEISAITLDRRNEKLYIATSNVITCIQYNIDKRYEVTELNGTNAISLAILNSDLFAVIAANDSSRSIQHCPLAGGAERCKFTSVYASVHDKVSSIKSLFKNENLKSPCGEKNGGCGYLCLLTSEPEHYSCACGSGCSLLSDKKSCFGLLCSF